jgi:hypothetical protein
LVEAIQVPPMRMRKGDAMAERRLFVEQRYALCKINGTDLRGADDTPSAADIGVLEPLPTSKRVYY